MIRVADHVLSEKLNNVYFIWGCGKEKVAEMLQLRYGFYVYRTDEARLRLMRKVMPSYRPHALQGNLRTCGGENGDLHLSEITPMILSELVILAAQHRTILCEGNLDYAAVIPLAVNAVHLRRSNPAPDWVSDFGIHSIVWPGSLPSDQTADAVADYFGFFNKT